MYESIYESKAATEGAPLRNSETPINSNNFYWRLGFLMIS
jgi:hypothetical protein